MSSQMSQLTHLLCGVLVDEDSREVTTLEVGCTIDYSLEDAPLTEVLRYQLLRDVIIQLGYKCKVLVFMFSSLGDVHRLDVRGLQTAGWTKTTTNSG